jgi:hypothetical protein
MWQKLDLHLIVIKVTVPSRDIVMKYLSKIIAHIYLTLQLT